MDTKSVQSEMIMYIFSNWLIVLTSSPSYWRRSTALYGYHVWYSTINYISRQDYTFPFLSIKFLNNSNIPSKKVCNYLNCKSEISSLYLPSLHRYTVFGNLNQRPVSLRHFLSLKGMLYINIYS